MAKSILGVLNKMGGKVKSGASLVGDKTGITDSKVYRDLANAPSGFISDLKNMLTIDDGNKEETVSLDIESIKNDKKIKKNLLLYLLLFLVFLELSVKSCYLYPSL